MQPDHDIMVKYVREILAMLGEDPDRNGLRDTPSRFLRALYDAVDRTNMPTPEQLMGVTFDADTSSNQPVIVGPIEFSSTCEHHLLPFTGTAWVSYIPAGNKVVGLSKFARLVDWHSKGLQVQERITTSVVDSIIENTGVSDAACLIQATHTCMATRGARKPQATMTTADYRGRFVHDDVVRSQFMKFSGEV